MTIEDFLKSKRISNPLFTYRDELKAVLTGEKIALNGIEISKETAKLGLELIGEFRDYTEYLNPYSKEIKNILELVTHDVWENEDNYQLLIYFFGKDVAPYVKLAWKRQQYSVYQSGYSKRSFRAPNNPKLVLKNQINFLRSLLTPFRKYDYESGKYGHYKVSLLEGIQYANDLGYNNELAQVWAAAIDLGNKEVFQLIEDIIYNKSTEGKVSRATIVALLNSEKKESWELVEKLLLAAQRQEGLRQVIFESLDLTTIQSLNYFIGVILEHKLTRFSSVVRAVDTWMGLGWEGEKESVIKSTLQLALQYLKEPETIAKGIKSTNNIEVYTALWAQGILDVDKTVPLLCELLEKGSVDKKCIALKFAWELDYNQIELPLYNKVLDETNLQVLAFAFRGLNSILNVENRIKNAELLPEFTGLFEKVHHLLNTIKDKNKNYEGKIFSWLNINYDRNQLFRALIYLVRTNKQMDVVLTYFQEMELSLKETLTRRILDNFYRYSFGSSSYYQYGKEQPKHPTEFQKKFALQIITERGESLTASAINTLSKIELSKEELEPISGLLKRKGATLRKELIALLNKQSDELIFPILQELLEKGDSEQRLAGLDLVIQLRKGNRMQTELDSLVGTFKERSKISEREQNLLSQLDEQEKSGEALSAANGYKLFNPNNRTSYPKPTIDPDSVYEKAIKINPYGFSISMDQLKDRLESLNSLYLKNGSYEYEVEYYDKTKHTVLLQNTFDRISYDIKNLSPQEQYNCYPLPEVWEKWYQDSKLKPIDLFLLMLSSERNNKDWKEIMDHRVFYYYNYLPSPIKSPYKWNNPLIKVLNNLALIHPYEEKNEFLIGANNRLFSELPESVLNFENKLDINRYDYRTVNTGWQGENCFNVFLDRLDLTSLTNQQSQTVWNLYRWRQFSGLEKNIPFNHPPMLCLLKVYAQGNLTKDELYEGVMIEDRLKALSNPNKQVRNDIFGAVQKEEILEQYPFLKEVYKDIREYVLNIEIKRGDSSTPVTNFAKSLQRIYGINHFVELMVGLEKTTFSKGYSYGELNKRELFSTLLQAVYPEKEDTQAEFNKAMKAARFKESRLIEAAIYAPQWQRFISNYLDWKGLDQAIWWMYAHTKTSGYQERSADQESEIAKYSSIDIQDFKDGAVDKEWFQNAYKALGKKRWEILYEAAKYISDGNGHRRARLYADTIVGDLKIKEVTSKVKDKRDQDYLRVYGLVPLSKVNPEKDVLARYMYLEQFKKESKQFGSMKQTSEALALRVAMENLARNAGYPDPQRLSWAMETKHVQNILSKETTVILEGVSISLNINEDGTAELQAVKDGKQLKSIPAKLKKNAAVVELDQHRKILRDQFSRSRKGLEEAMVRGDVFQVKEIQTLSEHPVICKHIEKLIFIINSKTESKTGFYKQGELCDYAGNKFKLKDSDGLRIAHCTDLHTFNVWSNYQSYCFDHQLVQPFKQVFRELYVPTADELREDAISRRYAGHQVQPKQTLALLKTRGWKVDYEEGLQKVYHKEGYQVKLYAMADWFSAADVEAPTLETIEFHDLTTYKNISFTSISPIIFSEVMRDIDLVVSVAHVGGVDPEASQSSIEMRGVLLQESMRLFKIENVEVKGSHVHIKGKLGNYSVHLGSAVVHQLPGKYLSILPVHSQHRGRIFLPFMDADPRTAEIIAKVLMLARDEQIQDPTVLEQIRR